MHAALLWFGLPASRFIGATTVLAGLDASICFGKRVRKERIQWTDVVDRLGRESTRALAHDLLSSFYQVFFRGWSGESLLMVRHARFSAGHVQIAQDDHWCQ